MPVAVTQTANQSVMRERFQSGDERKGDANQGPDGIPERIAQPPRFLKMTPMRILLTNDDGIDAPGLSALRTLLENHHPTVVAPDRQYSACGHQATAHATIPAEERSDGEWCVSGTPVDCVRLGLTTFDPEAEVVVSGINPGANLGVDLYMSGTVAAAREAAFMGRKAIALSHYRSKAGPFDWEAAAPRVRPVLEDLLARAHEPGTLWNVNLPHLLDGGAAPPVVECPPDPAPLQVSFERKPEGWLYAGDYHQRARTPGHDVDVCFDGNIAVSLITVGGG